MSNMSAGVQRIAEVHRARPRVMTSGLGRQRRLRDRVPRVLVRRLLEPARHHQAEVDAVRHAVRVERSMERVANLVAAHADVEVDRPGALEEPVEVRFEEDEPTLVQPHPFPDAVAEHEAGVEHGHLGVRAGDEVAVQVDEYVGVARVGRVILAAAHAEGARSIEKRRCPS
jgi:hypothetical protein